MMRNAPTITTTIRTMEGTPTVVRAPPPFPAPGRSTDISSVEFVLSVLALITIPALIYTFFFAIKCGRRRQGADSDAAGVGEAAESIEMVTYEKETHVGTECPVCLSAFAEGEEIKQLGACKHSFHACCINMWLTSHSNCPVCRAFVAAAKLPKRILVSYRQEQDDHHQGLPDAGSLV